MLLTHDSSKSLPCLQLEYLDFTAFYELPMPKFFLFEEDDVSLLSGNNALWLDFAARLVEANNGQGVAQTMKVPLAAFHTAPYLEKSENLPCSEITMQDGWTLPTDL